ncbi:unnamed protein product [Paramecium sonneborni]|uniref:EF-hand domain-containing protein n=1 Tax=Paramecium sonneborni TaxID=65129 RepID=A0A8S1L4I1_9CILI|nr:unnamed protein product [Paramecium sonneborni]
MIAIVQTPSTVQSTRQCKTPGEYDHFRRILKTRQRFPSSSDCKFRKSLTSPLKKYSANQTIEKRVLHTLQDRPKTQADLPERPPEYYNLFNLPYKNYKYQKPPGQINVAEYLEGTYKLGKTTGIWDKNILHKKLNVNNLQLKRSNYTSNHLIKARKPQGPSSCLETIYIAKLQLDNEQSNEVLIKMKAMEDSLKQDIQKYLVEGSTTQLQIKFPSQSYILNRWTRQSVGQDAPLCSKCELIPKFTFQKNQVNNSVESLKRSMIQFQTQENTSQITELPQPIKFLKFDPKINQFWHLYKTKGMTMKSLKTSFKIFQKPIIGDRLLLSFDLSPQNNEEKVSYKQFCHFMRVFVYKKAFLKESIDSLLNFYDPEKQQRITNREFININRILCEQFMENHSTVKPIYQELIQNFRLSKVISDENDSYFDQQAFKHVFISNQMNIQDIIELISDE